MKNFKKIIKLLLRILIIGECLISVTYINAGIRYFFHLNKLFGKNEIIFKITILINKINICNRKYLKCTYTSTF